ncbi:MAG: hypothetical protein ABSA33_01375 [Candidatus Micrarchaeaceae archaeon]
MRFTEKLRMYWDDLFYPALVERLETDLLMARSDIQQMKLDKDATIAELRAEKAQLSATSPLRRFQFPAAKNALANGK